MAQHPKLNVMTANRLSDGAVVYLTRDDRWTEVFADAYAAAGASEIARSEAAAATAVRDRAVVGPYLVAVSVAPDGSLRPLGQRERIRAIGPTVGTDLTSSPIASPDRAA